MYAELVLKSKTRMTDQIFTYSVPEDLRDEIQLGQRVLVPFGRGNRTSVGIVVGIKNQYDGDFETKDIYEIEETSPLINQELIELGFYMEEKYLSDLSSAFQTVLPPGDILNIEETYVNISGQGDFYDFLKKPKGLAEIRKAFPDYKGNKLTDLVDKGLIKRELKTASNVTIKTVRMVRLKVQEAEIPARAFKQQEIFDFLKEVARPISQKDLLSSTDSSLSTLRALEERDLVEIYQEEVLREAVEDSQLYLAHELTRDQRKVYNQVIQGGQGTFLLKGVTGSGKTEVYLQLAQHYLDQGKEVLIMVPEISLTPQTIQRFAGRFDEKVAVLHSRLLPGERFDQWRMVKEGIAPIVIGTRSSVFAPFKNLGIIIIDEEHEASYVSENNPRYDALEIAQERGRYHQAPVLLGSATPRVESYYRAQRGDYRLLELTQRTGGALPKTHVVDMREELKEGNTGMFSKDLHQSIQGALDRKEQVILFLNKRGFSSYVFCRRCGYIQKCDHCDVSLTYHSTKGISVCHICGSTGRKPLICPSCGSNAIKEFGAGTQQLENFTRRAFPLAYVYRMDQDTMGRKGSYDRVYQWMVNREIDILIGTQMLSKGFDFEGVTVVGVVAADISLNIPGYRASERTFQLLTQVAGRAGRGQDPGQVFIQSYEPSHYAIRAAKDHDYELFYENEIRTREVYKYPPFYDMVIIRVSHEQRAACIRRTEEILRTLNVENWEDLEIIGPHPANIERAWGRYRFNIIFKTKDRLEDLKLLIDDRLLKNRDLMGGDYSTAVSINPFSL